MANLVGDFSALTVPETDPHAVKIATNDGRVLIIGAQFAGALASVGACRILEPDKLPAAMGAPTLPDKVTFDVASEYAVRWMNSYEVFPFVLRLAADKRISRADWLRLLGDQWTRFDNIGPYKTELTRLLPRITTPSMMDEEERAALKALPGVVTVYRGADRRKNVDGFSWSLDRAVAKLFPFMMRYKADDPVIVRGQVARGNIIAVKLGRGEQEVISARVQVRTISAITEAEARA